MLVKCPTSDGIGKLGTVGMKPEVAVDAHIELVQQPYCAAAVLGPARATPAGGEGTSHGSQLVLVAPVHHLDLDGAHRVQPEPMAVDVWALVQGTLTRPPAPVALFASIHPIIVSVEDEGPPGMQQRGQHGREIRALVVHKSVPGGREDREDAGVASRVGHKVGIMVVLRLRLSKAVLLIL
ncbi:4-hydroxy-tetrahydrodipicolinate synthase [Striga asiatica]|uniref:4-hydroxy-tetrahydrodipicolinate synthase n=1 Tax=Striga asiatica TaxID=4170 RepID=A0A5A7P7M0_STRAF|nr:4-hydroxy-tetrahydrodipicolinate synthase [Striga asiatica]